MTKIITYKFRVTWIKIFMEEYFFMANLETTYLSINI